MTISRKPLALTLMILTGITATANAQLTPLQQRLLQDALPPGMISNMPALQSQMLPGHRMNAVTTDLRPTDHWGFRFSNVSPVLQQHVEAVEDGRGLVIDHIFPKSPAYHAGLRKGQILLGLKSTVFYKATDIPTLKRPTHLFILDRGLERRILIQPLNEPARPVAVPFLAPTIPLFPTTSIPAISGAVSVTGQNGLFNVNASTAEGNVKLRGTKTEINEQLKSVPSKTRTMIKQQLRTVE